MNSQAIPATERLQIPTSPSQIALLTRAAQRRHLDVSQFVLQSCLQAAEEVVQGQESLATIRVSAAEFGWLMEKLAEPPQEVPALRQLLGEAPVWNG